MPQRFTDQPRGRERVPTRPAEYRSLILFFALLAVFGGASRNDAPQQIVVAIGAIALIATSLLRTDAMQTPAKAILMGFGAVALLQIVQLVPLPYTWWAALPGHAPYAAALTAAEVPPVARPLNLTPGLGWASAMAVLPPLAVVLAAQWQSRQSTQLILAIIVIAVASATAGVLQAAIGNGAALRLYAIATQDAPVGLFANRNHQALFLALAFPTIGTYLAIHEAQHRIHAPILAATIAFALLIVASLVVTGSRAGAFIAIPAFVSMLIIARHAALSALSKVNRAVKWAAVSVVVLATIGIAAVAIVSRSGILGRFSMLANQEDSRFNTLPTIWKMALAFFPTGSGFGSFADAYRAFEPSATLSLEYLNQAHNDPLQIIVEGGLGGLFLIVAFVVWLVARARYVLRPLVGSPPSEVALARLGCIVILLCSLASFVDYPLRTPLIVSYFALSLYWVERIAKPGRGL